MGDDSRSELKNKRDGIYEANPYSSLATPTASVIVGHRYCRFQLAKPDATSLTASLQEPSMSDGWYITDG